MNDLKIKGHSGCSLILVESETGELLVKKSCNQSYVKRLYHQCSKQKAYSDAIENNIYRNIKVPYAQWKDDSIWMKYVHSQSFIEYFERSTTQDIKKLADTLCNFITDEIKNCGFENIDKSIFIEKIKSVQENCNKNELIDINRVNTFFVKANKYFDTIDNIVLPVGTCHGDLTFSNILFTESGMYFIDFLDSFIETPLQDIVKIRQDTLYGWSTMMTSQQYNKAHIQMVLQYIDKYIVSKFEQTEYFKYYNMLQYINILRILPYVKEKAVYERVCEILESIVL